MRTKQHYIPVEYHVLIAKLYSDMLSETDISCDHLPYTTAFEQLHARFCAASRISVSPHQLWEQLVNLRKSGMLAKAQRK